MREPLVYGVGNPTDKLNGIAYLQGWDTWSEITTTLGLVNSQPDKVQFLQIQKFPYLPPSIATVEAVLNATVVAMEQSLSLLASQAVASGSFSSPFVRELVDTANITYQRAVQVYNLVLVAHHAPDRSGVEWERAESALAASIELMAIRMRDINVPRVASWRPNPTAYHFTYLWTARSLFYFWRDRTQLYNSSMWSPCVMNIQDPVDVAFGEGVFDDAMKVLRRLIDQFGSRQFGECLAAPNSEPQYPQDAH
jgi:hypothetical protein